MKVLREYQQEAHEALFNYFEANSGNPIISAPVGAGKTLLIAEFIRDANAKYPGTNFIVLSHVAILLEQGRNELLGQWPEAHTSVYSAGLSSKRLDGKVIFASIQSIYKQAYKIPHQIHCVVIDECHLLSPSENTMYRKFISDLRKINPKVKVVGYSGTPFRTGQGSLHKGENALFTDVAFTISMTRLIEEGHLCQLETPVMKTQMNTHGLAIRNGEFVPGELERRVDVQETTAACVQEIIYHGHNRRKWLVFCAGMSHAEHTRDEFRRHGVSCDMITAKTPIGEQAEIMDNFAVGPTRCLVNISKVSTGVNIPEIDLIGIMKPMRSPIAYIQSLGRGLRNAPGKASCLVCDFGQVISTLGPVDKIIIEAPKGKGGGDAPQKICPQCHSYEPSGVRHCSFCSFEFPVSSIEEKLSNTASSAAVLSTQIRPTELPVKSWELYHHEKQGSPVSLRVAYRTGVTVQSEWICLQHQGFARDKAVRWWSAHGGQLPPPATVSEAITRKGELNMPRAIITRPSGKYVEIVGKVW